MKQLLQLTLLLFFAQITSAFADEAAEAADQKKTITPFISAHIDIPTLINQLEKGTQITNDTPLASLLPTLKAQTATTAQLALFKRGPELLQPLLVIRADKLQKEQLIGESGPLKPFIKTNENGSFSLADKVITQAKSQFSGALAPYPFAKLRIHIGNKSIILGTEELIAEYQTGNIEFDPFTEERAAVKESAISIATALPEKRPYGMGKLIVDELAKRNHPALAEKTGTIMLSITNFSAIFKPFTAVAIGFDYTPQRQLSIAMNLEDTELGQQYLSDFSDKKESNQTAELLYLLRDLSNVKTETDMQARDSNLTFTLTWNEKEDSHFNKTVSDLLFERFTKRRRAIGPSSGPIKERTAKISYQELTQDEATKIADNFGHFIYTYHISTSSDDVMRTYISCGPSHFTNADFTLISNARIAGVTTADKKQVLDKKAVDKQKSKTQTANKLQTLKVSLPKGTIKEKLKSARVELEMEIPLSFARVEFSKTDPSGSTKMISGTTFTLHALERNYVKISSSSEKPFHLIATNKTGDSLASQETRSYAHTQQANFYGEIDKITILLPQKTIKLKRHYTINLNGGKNLRGPRRVTSDTRLRYRYAEPTLYAPVDKERLKKTALQITSSTHDGHGSISWDIADGKYKKDSTDWQVYNFGESSPITTRSTNSDRNGTLEWRTEEHDFKRMRHWWGTLEIKNAYTEIKTITLKRGERKNITLPSTEAVAYIDKNSVIIESPKRIQERIITTIARAADGYALYDAGSSSSGGSKNSQKEFFWGPVESATIQFGLTKEDIIQPFVLTSGDFNRTAHEKYRAELDIAAEFHRELIKAGQYLSRFPRTNISIADLYFARSSKGDLLKGITKEMAQSDPTRAALYGYEAKPYKGYTITTTFSEEVNKEKHPLLHAAGITILPATKRHPYIIATPIDNSKKSLICYGQSSHFKTVYEINGPLPTNTPRRIGHNWQPLPTTYSHHDSYTNHPFKYRSHAKVEKHQKREPFFAPSMQFGPESSTIEELLRNSLYLNNVYYSKKKEKSSGSFNFYPGKYVETRGAYGSITPKNIVKEDGIKVKIDAQKNRYLPKAYALSNNSYPFSFKDSDTENIKSIEVDIDISYPSDIEEVTFTPDLPQWHSVSAGDYSITLAKFEPQIFEVLTSHPIPITYKGFDAAGAAVPLLYCYNKQIQQTAIFQRPVSKVITQLPITEKRFKSSLSLPYSKGRGYQFPTAPSNTIRERHKTNSSRRNYMSFPSEELKNLKATWDESRGAIEITLGDAPVSHEATWNILTFAEKKPTTLRGYASNYDNKSFYRFHKTPSETRFIGGSAELKIFTNVLTLKGPDTDKLPAGVQIKCDKNQIMVEAPTTYSILRIRGFNDDGVELLAHTRQSSKLPNGSKTFSRNFWGVPTSYSIQLATTPVTTTVPVAIKLGSYDKEAFDKYKEKKALNKTQQTVSSNTRTTVRNARKITYGNDKSGETLNELHQAMLSMNNDWNVLRANLGIAPFHYANNRQGKPLKHINAAMAHADPLGASTFNYTHKPWNGYTITVIKADRDNINFRQGFLASGERFIPITTDYRDPGIIAYPNNTDGTAWVAVRGQIWDAGTFRGSKLPPDYKKLWKRTNAHLRHRATERAYFALIKKRSNITLALDDTSPEPQLFNGEELQKNIVEHFTPRRPSPQPDKYAYINCNPPGLTQFYLASINFKPISVTSQSGEELLKEVKHYPTSRQNANNSAFSFSLPLNKKVPGADIASCEFEATIYYPSALAKIEIDDIKRSSYNRGDTQITVLRLNGPVLEFVTNQNKKPLVIAHNRDGKRLVNLATRHSNKNIGIEFSGIPHRLTLYYPKDEKSFSFKKRVLFNEETYNKAKDYTKNPQYTNSFTWRSEFNKEAFTKASVGYFPKYRNGHNYLRLPLKNGGHGKHTWKITTISADKITRHQDKSSHNNGNIAWYNKETNDPHILRGSITVEAHDSYENIVFTTAGDGTFQASTKEGKTVTASVKGNRIFIDTPADKIVLNCVNVNKYGHISRWDQSGIRGGRHYYALLSKPKLVIVQLADKETKPYTKEFEIKIKDVDQKLLRTLKESEIHDDMRDNLRSILHSMKQHKIAATTSGIAILFYSYDYDENPLEAIAEGIAKSDPLGANTFDYKPQPFKGYSYSFAKGVLQNGKKVPYPLENEVDILAWHGGMIELKRYPNNIPIIAIPTDKEAPAFILFEGQLHSAYDKDPHWVPENMEGWENHF